MRKVGICFGASNLFLNDKKSQETTFSNDNLGLVLNYWVLIFILVLTGIIMLTKLIKNRSK